MTGSVLRTRPVPRQVWQVLPTCWRLVRRWMFHVRPDPAQSRHFSRAGNCRITATSEQAAACNADGVALGFGLGGSARMGSIVHPRKAVDFGRNESRSFHEIAHRIS